MQKTLLVTLLTIIVVVGGFLMLRSKQIENKAANSSDQRIVEPKSTDEKTTTTPESSTEIVITFGSNGFSPAAINIKRGQKVTFKNESGKQMWVASDDHPSHLIYPEFDAKNGFANGSSYEFVFDKVGTWHYHDHLSSNKTGIVVVE